MANRTTAVNRILIATNIITVALAAYLFFRTAPADIAPEAPPCCNYEDLNGETLDDFKNVVKLYKDNVWTQINTNTNLTWTSSGSGSTTFEDARCIWFSMDSIKQFICTIEKYSEQLHLTTANLGIRFYYGQYPMTNLNYPSRHTIFMMPTFSTNNTDPAVDFDPRFNVLNGWGTTTVPDSIKSFKSGINAASPSSTTLFTILGGEANPNPSIRNSGELCPPKCVPALNNTFDLTDR